MTAHEHTDGKMWDTTEEVDALLGPCAVIMRRIGMWQPPGGEPAGAKLLVTAVLLLIMSSVIIGGFVKIIVDPPPDFDTTSEGLFTAACTFTWAVRIVSILVRQNRVQQLVVDVLNMRKRFTEDSADLRRSYHRRSMIVCVVWMIFPLVGMPMWFVEPALAKTLITTPENTTIVIRKTPLLIWMPIDTQTHPNYEITYVFQLFMLATVVQVNVVVDLFFACLMVNVTADIAILNNIIANMRLHKEDGLVKKSAEGDKISTAWEITYKSKKPVAEKGEPYDENAAVQTQYDAEPSTQLYRTLVKNIQHHQIIMSIINDLESLMSESSVLMLGVNSVNICLQGLGFVDAFRPGAKRSTVLKKVLTFPAYINQTAHFCWYGQEIIDQSERLLESAFSCGWPEADKRFCSTLRIFMLQVSRPLKLQIGKVFTLSRNLFLQILNTSYTIFNMMINF
ncbi:odorant receptor coreceptor-like [Schistocerca serialis cubense]|uniref:odorant receptor coreceptor-like n=1 Tax=Schistocerca serialis cubense TaxID=2023355 RepID=UPI00214F5FD8|nr:odorant receptor coreceptor-like [Schistocerca serialis cubense]